MRLRRLCGIFLRVFAKKKGFFPAPTELRQTCGQDTALLSGNLMGMFFFYFTATRP